MKKEKTLFCDRGPLCYAISWKKEIAKRRIQDWMGHETFAKNKEHSQLPNLVWSQSSGLIKRAPGVNLQSQKNKAVNIRLACEAINGLMIRPGEVFSFWHIVGNTTRRKGYLEGRVIQNNRLISGLGGGLCNLGNTLHLLVLHSPLTVTEFHHHSDALAPDEGERKPFGTGTSVCYNHVDYRFRNDTDQTVQLLTWCEGETLFAELRSERAFPKCYELVEENHHFKKENGIFYRNSQIYRVTSRRDTGEPLGKELILDNHSRVMFDEALIPRELIREGE